LFLRKWKKEETDRLVQQKTDIECKLLKDSDYFALRSRWDNEIKQKQKEKATEIKDKLKISATEAKKTEEYKSWNSELLAEYADKVEDLKTRLTEENLLARQQELTDYPIFMAIAEEIGYDATGKKTATNELDIIGQELKNFIKIIDDDNSRNIR
jgi:type I restriction enzyme M protein